METSDPLPRLRKIRDAKRRAEKLAIDRDGLIRRAIEDGHSERKVAEAVGLTPGRVHQIVDGA